MFTGHRNEDVDAFGDPHSVYHMVHGFIPLEFWSVCLDSLGITGCLVEAEFWFSLWARGCSVESSGLVGVVCFSWFPLSSMETW